MKQSCSFVRSLSSLLAWHKRLVSPLVSSTFYLAMVLSLALPSHPTWTFAP